MQTTETTPTTQIAEKNNKAAIYTLGCRVNQYESEVIAELLEKEGFTVFREGGCGCNVCIINTCTVTGESDRKCGQVIRRAVKDNPFASVIVTGCFAQTSPDKVLKIKGVDYVCGNADKLSVVSAALRLNGIKNAVPEECISELSGASFEKMSAKRSERTRAYIKIEDGCENRCAYCIIPRARGKIRSKTPEDILSEAIELKKSGYREIVLTGIEVAGYGKDTGNFTLADVICMLDEKVGFERISLGSLEPSLMRAGFADRIAALNGISHHFHLSLQSGCDRTLAAMRRKYNTETVAANVTHIRELIPDCMFTADIIVGFPGESDEDFAQTCNFVKSLKLLYAHVFSYSRRPGTEADTLPCQIDAETKNRRSAELISLCLEEKAEILREYAARGGVYPALFEEKNKKGNIGRLNNYIEVSVDSERNLAGEILPVRITGCDREKLTGELV